MSDCIVNPIKKVSEFTYWLALELLRGGPVKKTTLHHTNSAVVRRYKQTIQALAKGSRYHALNQVGQLRSLSSHFLNSTVRRFRFFSSTWKELKLHTTVILPPRRFWWILAFFDQVARPSRLVLGKKFFHIWFIYTREGCVLVLHLFFLQSVIYETPYCAVIFLHLSTS